MIYFTVGFTSFLEELAHNNSKDWFDENRKRYLIDVKEPFDKFIHDLIDTFEPIDEPMTVRPNDCIFRINRDIRFSKDKTPYKINRSAIVSKYGKKDKEYPGFYIQISPEKILFGGGLYQLSTKKLYAVRQEIAYNLEEFSEIVNVKSFKENFNQIQGAKAKRLPKEFQEDAKQQKLLYNKGFFFMKDLPVSLLYTEDLLPTLRKLASSAVPLNHFFRRALTEFL